MHVCAHALYQCTCQNPTTAHQKCPSYMYLPPICLCAYKAEGEGMVSIVH